MKKWILIFAASMSLTFFSVAQSFQNSDKLLNLGIGIGSPFFGKGYSSSLPVNPTLSFEKAVTDEISAGGTVAFASSKLKVFDLKYNAYYIGARGAYHFATRDNLDLYAGGGIGYVVVSVGDNTYGTALGSAVGYSAFVGGRYYFSGKAGLYAELGYGSLSVLNAGISFKF